MVEVPLRNVWLLQFLASRLYRDGVVASDAEQAPDDLPELVAQLLWEEVTQRLHTGLTVGFRHASRDLHRVRGRIEVLPTTSLRLLERVKVRCTFDEIVTDTPANRLVRAGLQRAAVLLPGDARYRYLARQLETAGVRGPCPALSQVPGMRTQRLLARDHRMISAAELLLTFTIPDTVAGRRTLPLPSLDPRTLQTLFEWAAYGYYRHLLTPSGWSVRHGQRLWWDTSFMTPTMSSLLPGMQTDITVQHPNPAGAGPRRLIIDTKFTSLTTVSQYRAAGLKSGYLYQIYAYVMSQRDRADAVPTDGLMLHPVVDAQLHEEAVIQGHRFRFATVDLLADSREVLAQFRAAIAPATQ